VSKSPAAHDCSQFSVPFASSLLGIKSIDNTNWRVCGASATHELYPYIESATHGVSQALQFAAPFKYAERQVTVEFVSVSKLVIAA
jgi:hypothetical protein